MPIPRKYIWGTFLGFLILAIAFGLIFGCISEGCIEDVKLDETLKIVSQIEQPISAADFEERLAEKANKQSVAQALHRKANKQEFEQLLAKKVDFDDLQQMLESKADITQFTNL